MVLFLGDMLDGPRGVGLYMSEAPWKPTGRSRHVWSETLTALQTDKNKAPTPRRQKKQLQKTTCRASHDKSSCFLLEFITRTMICWLQNPVIIYIILSHAIQNWTDLLACFDFVAETLRKSTKHVPIGSMGLVYLPTWMDDFYGFHVGKYSIYMDPSWDMIDESDSSGPYERTTLNLVVRLGYRVEEPQQWNHSAIVLSHAQNWWVLQQFLFLGP